LFICVNQSKTKKIMTDEKEEHGLTKRIKREIQRLDKDAAPGVIITPHEDNLRYLHITIEGPKDSPYEGGVFELEMFLADTYPMKPPKCRFLTKIYHPNVDQLGRICLDILKDKWTPALTVTRVCLSLQLLMQEPNPDDPLDNKVADQWKNDIDTAHKIAQDWTKKYAKHNK